MPHCSFSLYSSGSVSQSLLKKALSASQSAPKGALEGAVQRLKYGAVAVISGLESVTYLALRALFFLGAQLPLSLPPFWSRCRVQVGELHKNCFQVFSVALKGCYAPGEGWLNHQQAMNGSAATLLCNRQTFLEQKLRERIAVIEEESGEGFREERVEPTVARMKSQLEELGGELLERFRGKEDKWREWNYLETNLDKAIYDSLQALLQLPWTDDQYRNALLQRAEKMREDFVFWVDTVKETFRKSKQEELGEAFDGKAFDKQAEEISQDFMEEVDCAFEAFSKEENPVEHENELQPMIEEASTTFQEALEEIDCQWTKGWFF